ncbi:hypothetical protein C9I92_21580 [Photobacterium ganghwense]|uniref:Uncharacterized protein n=1 Tax=Photobacterium ganghwense TaxID=320778 RepID=A0A0J1HEV7_9GAMM|nr:hypothetical protein ABT57_06040 [Photobacterium ganghwense]PSU05387.1 hypothetical protein C9I92_21580 [Photobacterium ganghwense]
MYLDTHSRLLIADTAEILQAFIENGLHHEYQIYCQFPHCIQMDVIIGRHLPLSIEFNDGTVISEPSK